MRDLMTEKQSYCFCAYLILMRRKQLHWSLFGQMSSCHLLIRLRHLFTILKRMTSVFCVINIPMHFHTLEAGLQGGWHFTSNFARIWLAFSLNPTYVGWVHPKYHWMRCWSEFLERTGDVLGSDFQIGLVP